MGVCRALGGCQMVSIKQGTLDGKRDNDRGRRRSRCRAGVLRRGGGGLVVEDASGRGMEFLEWSRSG